MLWAPFYAGGHLVAQRLQAAGRNVEVDGASFPYRQAVCVAGLVYGLIGYWFSYRLARQWFTAGVAATAMAVMALGSFMLWYLVKEPSMTHAPAMAGVAAFVYAWARTRDRRTLLQWALLGLLAGFITNIRWQNALFALLPAAEWLWSAGRELRGRSPDARTLGLAAFLFGCGAIVGFAPQMLAWKAIYASYLAISPVGPQIRWWDSHVVDILWSSRNGLFSTSPIVYLATIGLLGMIVVDWRFGVPATLVVAAMVYFNGAIQDWWGSAAYGMRRFDGVVSLLVVGLAAAISWLERWLVRHTRAVVGTLLLLLVLWNTTFMSAALSGAFGVGELISFSDVGGAQARVLHRWIGHPFSWPVNVLWAIRNGESPGRYDLLGAGRFLSDPSRPYGRVDLGTGDEVFLGDGWHAAERSHDTTYRWARDGAGLLVPLDHATPLILQVRTMPLVFPGVGPMGLRVSVNGRWFGPHPLQPGWQLVEFSVPDTAWRSGVNRIVLGLGREFRPRDIGLGDDDRPMAAAFDYVRVKVP
jgi:hypothetical protein